MCDEPLYAVVTEIVDLYAVAAVPVFRNRIGLDLIVKSGNLKNGLEILLVGPNTQEQVSILGIELHSVAGQDGVVRVHCTKPKSINTPIGKVEGWSVHQRKEE